ncbi:hypothetical protein HYH03_009506 [Edaphochlamys debaryana]|uniref:Uncharacterized protein n=1 Tax=Edaphochlamys debaryana TaxID=47281 RepID=A0A836BX19_9CHLO|nr:hypothetical protein HYH03_009506 [Edaphochlamys debaryana]|eukprot:KAG2492266.1 hypothetical protein HYH03_009506 [Edaphochlamys debaryana]
MPHVALQATEQSSLKTPEWVPEQAGPILRFLEATDFSLEESKEYKEYIKNFGWKELPETINGRAAMLGFLAGAGAEIFGQGSVLSQLGQAPQPVVVVMLLIAAASAIPIYRATEGDFLPALKDVYGPLPGNVFTQANERVHGRLAMVGLLGLLAVELVIGKGLL